ncbi:MAG TPA: hypothetical protein DER60_12845 [Syntrophomonas sp.]|nr:hypothetical protein [Syntrophomonas sp.]
MWFIYINQVVWKVILTRHFFQPGFLFIQSLLESVDGLKTEKPIYPDLFNNVDMLNETTYFYKRCFDFELSETDVQKIMEGKEFKKMVGEVKANR